MCSQARVTSHWVMRKRLSKRNRIGFAVGLLAVGFGLASLGAQEETEAPQSGFRRWLEQDYMLGDWGGLRSDLSKRGIDFEFFYGGSVARNNYCGPRGGAPFLMAVPLSLFFSFSKISPTL